MINLRLQNANEGEISIDFLIIQTVADDVKTKKKTVKNPRSYILGYAKRVEWNDAVDNFAAPWEA